MKKSGLGSHISKRFDKTIDLFFHAKEPPKWIFVLILILYLLNNFFVVKIAKAPGIITLFGTQIPINLFTGVLSAFGNICIIMLVVFYKNLGYLTSVLILFFQFPILIVNLVVRHLNSALPGMFTNMFTMAACTLIFIINSIIDKYQKKIGEQAVTDSLTGLPNRFACTEIMNGLIKNSVNFVLVSIDLNNFKSINDTMGNEVGDKVLKEIACRWKTLSDSDRTKTNNLVTRLGGDEFAVIIKNYKFKGDILNTIIAFKSELEKTITIDDCDYFMTASFGCAEYPIDADNSTTLFSCADAAMHKVKKQNSSNPILRYTPDLLEKEHTLEIERKIRVALDTDSIFFYLQPQFDMDKKLRGFEALARMKDTEGVIIRPSEFIPIAEKNGLIDRVDTSVLKKASLFLAEALKKNPELSLSFNVSVKHLMKNSFVEELKEIVRSTGIPAENLELEITESIMIDSVEKALNHINEVKQMGIKVAIDDFGTGYSSLSYLSKLPSDMLKIDKSFIDAMNKSESSKQYVASIVSIGHIFNLKVISEGVEQPEQLETLRNIGCDFIQGFLWGRPLPPEEAAKLV